MLWSITPVSSRVALSFKQCKRAFTRAGFSGLNPKQTVGGGSGGARSDAQRARVEEYGQPSYFYCN
jgi:hypothetical protein